MKSYSFTSKFTFYKFEIENLIEHIKDAKSASFDVDEDGFVTVYVEGKEPLKL